MVKKYDATLKGMLRARATLTGLNWPVFATGLDVIMRRLDRNGR